MAAVSLALEDSELPPELLTLEITESVMALETEATTRRLRQLKGLGVRLAIDDFGTGYSSLSYLRRFPVDVVKIDKSFVDGIVDEVAAAALAARIVQLAHSLKMKTVAEGVEIEAQVKRLVAMGCDQAQGFLYFAADGRPPGDRVRRRPHDDQLWVGHAGHELEVIERGRRRLRGLHPGSRSTSWAASTTSGSWPRLGRATGRTSSARSSPGTSGPTRSVGGLVDLGAYMARDDVDRTGLHRADAMRTPAAMSDAGRCPLLADTYGLYFNRDAACCGRQTGRRGRSSELAEYAKRLTTRNADGSLQVVGFNPIFGFYENNAANFGHQFGATGR